jgi:RNA polymerase sigma factor (sigma-70 family)
MATVQMQKVLKHLRKILAPREHSDDSDWDLLERFDSRRDEAAFEALVWRHHHMVLSVCSRTLSDSNDVEDAFQATFLVLARRAGSIRRAGSLSNWLFGVARRVALEARTRAARRHRTEFAPVPSTCPDPCDAMIHHELRGMVGEELARLPEKYRVPVVLCYLVGLTYEEAGKQLRCSKGTLSTRLTRARELLRIRLARRGLAISAGSLTAWFLANGRSAATPNELITATVDAARSVIGASPLAGTIPPKVAALTNGAVRAMFLSKLKIAAAILMALVVGVGATAITFADKPEKPLGQTRQSHQGKEVKGGPQISRLNDDASDQALRDLPAGVAAERAREMDSKGRILFAQFPRDTPITDQGGVGAIRLGDKKAALLFERPDLRKGIPTAYRLSPDAKKVAYTVQVRAGDKNLIYVRSLDPAGQPEEMNVEGTHVSWSPDGQQLLVSRGQSGGVVVDLKTRKQAILDLPPQQWAIEWSPDGKAFLARFENNNGKGQLAWMNRDDHKLQPLAGTEGSWDGRISPDGNEVLFILPLEKTGSNVWVLNRRDGKTRKINQELNCSVRCASWSPSGKRIAYTLTRFDPDSKTPPFQQETESFVMVSDADGQHQEVVVSGITSGISAIDFTLWDWR